MPLDIKDHLLACAGEEAGEIQQTVGKALRFGMFDRNPVGTRNNWVDFRKEVHDMIAVYELLCDEFDRVETLDRKMIDEKKSRIAHYMEYSSDIGRLITEI